jgi:hypothetical protein
MTDSRSSERAIVPAEGPCRCILLEIATLRRNGPFPPIHSSTVYPSLLSSPAREVLLLYDRVWKAALAADERFLAG